MATIDDLNEDCLIEVFSYLDIRQRQRLELVCKKWQEINQVIWRTMRKLEYMVINPNNSCSLIAIRNGLKIKSKNLSYLGLILKKFNGNLEKLAIITEFFYDMPLDIPSWIFKLIIENENLISLEINLNNKPIYKECLKFLKTDNLQHLSLSLPVLFKHSSSVLDVMKKLMLSAPRLETLHLTNVQISIQEINKITTLKSLYLTSIGKSLTLSVKKFNFINLESIHLLLCNDVKDKFIKQLVNDCKELCNVEVHACDKITVRGLIPITTLPKLRHFGARYVDDEVFDKLSNLESVVCGYLTLNENTMNNSIYNFFKRSPNLRKADVCVNGDDYLLNEYARQSNININADVKFYHSCLCEINWRKQFDN